MTSKLDVMQRTINFVDRIADAISIPVVDREAIRKELLNFADFMQKQLEEERTDIANMKRVLDERTKD